MLIKDAFILSAGMGTRMGPLGKILPKPLWPVCGLTLLELQIMFAKKLGAERIFINIHHRSELIKKFIKLRQLDVVWVHEKELLGSGGAHHNLKSNFPDIKKIWILNSDNLLLLSTKRINELLNLLEPKIHHLIGLPVSKNSGYNQVVTDAKNFLVGIRTPYKQRDEYFTYSGLGVLDYEAIEVKKGESSFFQTVCVPERKDSKCIPERAEFLEWGTLEDYLNFQAKDTHQALFDYFPTQLSEVNRSSSEYIEIEILEDDILLKGSEKLFGHKICEKVKLVLPPSQI